MRKFLYCILLGVFTTIAGHAQNTDDRRLDSLQSVVNDLSKRMKISEDDRLNDAIWKQRRKYFMIGYVKQTLKHEEIEGLEWKSDYGFFLSYGRTYYLHRKPLFKMIKFGLDLTLPDLTYVKYSEPQVAYGDDSPDLDLGVHQAEIGLPLGPSLTINPVSHLKVSGYFHFVPSASVIVLDSEVNVKYVSFFTCGGAIAYKTISFGIESRWGSANYKSFSGDDDESSDSFLSTDNNKLKTNSTRFYLALRF